ncbi:MAG: CBS domain-containing protein [Proteobacteria bacterium]|nr:CBS domain-containing protein [Pseudomonadota bacterium]
MNIQSIIAKRSSDVVTISPDATLKQAANLLNEKRIGALPVASEGKLVGIISERDIVRICASSESNPLETLVKSAMSTNLEIASLKDTIDMALARMTDRRIRHLPVVEAEKLVGIVSIGDLVKKQIDNVIAEADAMRAYIHS